MDVTDVDVCVHVCKCVRMSPQCVCVQALTAVYIPQPTQAVGGPIFGVVLAFAMSPKVRGGEAPAFHAFFLPS